MYYVVFCNIGNMVDCVDFRCFDDYNWVSRIGDVGGDCVNGIEFIWFYCIYEYCFEFVIVIFLYCGCGIWFVLFGFCCFIYGWMDYCLIGKMVCDDCWNNYDFWVYCDYCVIVFVNIIGNFDYWGYWFWVDN